MNVEIPDHWKSFIHAQVKSGRYFSKNEILDEALKLLRQRDEQEAANASRIEALLLQGLNSGPSTPMTNEDWEAIEREGDQLIADRKAADYR